MRETYVYCSVQGKVVPKSQKVREREGPDFQIASGPGEPLASYSLPLNWPYAPRHDKEGRACFTGMKEIRESVAKAQAAGEPVEYHRGLHNY